MRKARGLQVKFGQVRNAATRGLAEFGSLASTNQHSSTESIEPMSLAIITDAYSHKVWLKLVEVR
jgi:hypothetical protein